jgi:hypothetical protein
MHLSNASEGTSLASGASLSHALLSHASGASAMSASDASLPFQSSAYSFPSQMSNYGFPTPTSATNLAPNSFTPVYAYPVSTNSFAPVYAPSVSTPGFSFSAALQDPSWNDPTMWTSDVDPSTWLQSNLSPISALRTSLSHEHSTDLDSLPVLPHPNSAQLPVLLPYSNPLASQGSTPDNSIPLSSLNPGVEAVATEPIANSAAQTAPTEPAHTTNSAHAKSIDNRTASQPSGQAAKPSNKPTTKASHKLGAKLPGAKSSSSTDAALGSGLTNDSTNTRASRRVPVKSRRNELADAIGTDVVSSFVGKLPVDAGAQPLLKRPARNEPASSKYVILFIFGFYICSLRMTLRKKRAKV